MTMNRAEEIAQRHMDKCRHAGNGVRLCYDCCVKAIKAADAALEKENSKLKARIAEAKGELEFLRNEQSV